MKTLIATVAATLAVAAAPLAAHAERYELVDLRGLDLSTDTGFQKAELAVRAAADARCGRTDVPQPLELAVQANACQKGFIADGVRAVKQLREKQVAGKAAANILALR